MKKSFILFHPRELKNIVFSSRTSGEKKQNQDIFHFIFGKKDVQINRILADFISPRVSHIHQIDPTVDFLELKPPHLNDNDNFFTAELIENFKLISSGNCIEIDEEMSNKLRHLSILLGNKEIYRIMNELFEKVADIDKFLEFDIHLDDYKPEFSKEIYFDNIARQFYSIPTEKLKKLSKQDFYSIISNENLRLKNEDSLFEIINEIFSHDNNDNNDNNDDYFNKMIFYEQIEICNLSLNNIKELIKNININNMTQPFWLKLSDFMIDQITTENNQNDNKKVNEKRYNTQNENLNNNVISVPYNDKLANQFNGILSKISNGNPIDAIDKGVIDITASSVEDSSEEPKNVVDYNDFENGFCSDNKPDSWICFDFKEQKVKLSHYMIMSNTWGDKGYSHLQNWCIEGSNDSKNWKILDNRQNEKSLDSKGATNTFNIQNQMNGNEFYRYIRIKQNGKNTCENHYMTMSSVEFFGLIQKEYNH